MSEKKANAQTIATAKHHKKVGYISKSYKLKKTLTDVFSKECERRGVSAAGALAQFMTRYVEIRKWEIVRICLHIMQRILYISYIQMIKT